MEYWAKKIRINRPKACSKHVWTLLRMILGLLGFLKFFEDSTLHGTLGKNFFSKRTPQNTFGHLEKFFEFFGNLKLFWLFSSIFSKSLPQKLSLENWTQFFYVRKTELIFLSSGIWTHNFKSRTSEMELRIMTVAWMQKNVCWVLCRKTELIFLSPEN